MDPRLTLALGVVALVGSFSAGWGVRGWREDAARLAESQALQQERQDAVRKVEGVAQAYLRGKAEAEVREIEVEQEVIRVVSKPVYLERCLDDDGLRILIDDVAAANARRGLAPALPGSAAAR